MNDPAPLPAGWMPTLRHEWALVIIVALVIAVSIAFDPIVSPKQEVWDVSPMTLPVAVALAVGHTGWISLDLKRRRRQVGGWRSLALLFGPIVVWIYMLVEYRLFGLALIWLSLGLYVFAFGLGAAGAHFLPMVLQTGGP